MQLKFNRCKLAYITHLTQLISFGGKTEELTELWSSIVLVIVTGQLLSFFFQTAADLHFMHQNCPSVLKLQGLRQKTITTIPVWGLFCVGLVYGCLLGCCWVLLLLSFVVPTYKNFSTEFLMSFASLARPTLHTYRIKDYRDKIEQKYFRKYAHYQWPVYIFCFFEE